MVLAVVLTASIPLGVHAGVGVDEHMAVMATPGVTLSLFCVPDGSGDPFEDAYVLGGSGGWPVAADATITLTMRDHAYDPIPYYPAEDIWLQWTDESTLFVCDGGTIPDSDTDVGGVTRWQSALRLGGHAEVLVQVRVNGIPLTHSAGFPLYVNSPDINADGKVDLIDAGLFSRDFANPAVPYRSDFVSDGVMNVADLGKMVRGVGTACP